MTVPTAVGPHGNPAADIDVDEPLVRALLRDQCPDLAEQSLLRVAAGWDNVTFRLGESLAVRLPRRAASARLVEHEQRWLPMLARTLPIPVPAAIRMGKPGNGYPWCWSVLPWLEGASADLHEPASSEAERFGKFLAALHRPAPPDAPSNPYRGVPLHARAAVTAARAAEVAKHTTLLNERVMRVWDDALAAPIDIEPTWIHGDLHPANVLVAHDAISGIIDWGDMAAGDRATDLAAIWMTFGDRAARDRAMRSCGDVSAATWARAQGWAVLFAIVLAASGIAGDPHHLTIATRTLERILQDAD